MGFESKDFSKQVELLGKRGMKFKDAVRAESTLQYISYYKIKEFSEPYAIQTDEDIKYEDIYFEDVISRYYRDKNLRLHILHAIEDIEVALQTQIAFNLGTNTGEYGYLRANNWADIQNFPREYVTKTQDKIVDRIEYQVKIAKENPKSYHELINKLNDGQNSNYPPVWLAVNLLMFGNLVYMLEIMSRRNKEPIADYFNCSMNELYDWMKMLNLVRNVSAHNSNFIDMHFVSRVPIRQDWKEILYVSEEDENIVTDRIAVPILLILYFMKQINPSYHIRKIKGILEKLIYTDIDAQYYGFKNKKAMRQLFKKELIKI
ncbi:Abi family protein [Facklamia languida]